MEAFEQFAAIHLEQEGLVVAGPVKFPVTRQTKRKDYPEVQTHGYEVDLVGVCADRLVLATVKSFLGSRGVQAKEVIGEAGNVRAYALLNDPVIRKGVISRAAKDYGYPLSKVELRLYVGKFAGAKKGEDQAKIRAWCSSQKAGGADIRVFALEDIIGSVLEAASTRTYRDNPVLVTIKALAQAGVLLPEKAHPILRPPKQAAPPGMRPKRGHAK